MVNIAYIGPYDRLWEGTKKEINLSATYFARKVEDLDGSCETVVVDVRKYILRYSLPNVVLMGAYDPQAEDLFFLWSNGKIRGIGLKCIDKSLVKSNIESFFFTLLQIGTPVDKPLLERICAGHIS